VKSWELVDAAIGRIKAINDELNAVIMIRFEEARHEVEGRVGARRRLWPRAWCRSLTPMTVPVPPDCLPAGTVLSV
jgi:hypothetical protein